MSAIEERVGGFLLPQLAKPALERFRYDLGAGVFLTALWSGLTVVLFFAPFSIWLYALVALLSVFVLFRSPPAGVAAMLVTTMLFESFFTLQPLVIGDTTYKFYLLDTLLVLTAAAFAAKGFFKNFRLAPLDWAVLAFDAVLFAFFIVSFSQGNSDPALAVSTFKTYVFYSAFYFLVRRLAFEAQGLKLVASALLMAGAGILVFLGLGVLQGQGLWSGATPLSTAGDRILSPVHAFYLLFPFLIVLASSNVSRVGRSYTLVHILRPALLWLWLFGIVFSLARHLWVVLGVQLLVLGYCLPAVRATARRYFLKPLIAFALMGIIIGGYLLVVPSDLGNVSPLKAGQSLLARVASVFSSGDVSIEWRIAFWREALNQVIHHPLTGIGLGQNITFQLSGVTSTVPVREMHNSMFALAVQAGAVGLIAFLALIWHAFRQVAWRLPRQAVPAAALLGVLVASLFGTYFEANFLILFFWLSLGWLAGAKDMEHEAWNMKHKINR